MFVAVPAEAAGSIKIGRILYQAELEGTLRSVAQQLVGATLKYRFPHSPIELVQLDEESVEQSTHFFYKLGSTAFLVTDKLTPYHLDRFASVAGPDLKKYILVTAMDWASAVSVVELSQLAGRAALSSIEDFTGLMLDLAGGYLSEGQRAAFTAMLEEYNTYAIVGGDGPDLQIEVVFTQDLAAPSTG